MSSRLSSVTLSLLGDGGETSVGATGKRGSTGGCVLILLAAPLVVLSLALCDTALHGQDRQHGQILADARRQDPQRQNSSLPTLPSADRLFPEACTPEGQEVVLAIPYLAAAAPGETMVKPITDRSGRVVLYTGLASAPGGGECVLLATEERQKIAFCVLSGAARHEGCSGELFRGSGECYARLREERSSEVGRSSTFAVCSAVGASCELRATGNFQEWILRVEDGAQRLVATVSREGMRTQPHAASGRTPTYELRIGPHADTCLVLLSLLGIERLLGRQGRQGELSAHTLESRSASFGSSPALHS